MAIKRKSTGQRAVRKGPTSFTEGERRAAAKQARRLAQTLIFLAERLEKPELADGDFVPFNPDRAAFAIRRASDGLLGIAQDNSAKANAQRRELALRFCQESGEALRLAESPTDRALASKVVSRAIKAYVAAVPEHETVALANEKLFRDLVLACAFPSKGGRGKKSSKSAATEALCDALGFPADIATIKRTRQRRETPRH
jgi:hypothetical protein